MTIKAQRYEVVIFSHNRRDTSLRKRVSHLQAHASRVTTFSFRRDGEPEFPGPPWNNVDLGYIEHVQFFKRAMQYLFALQVIFKNRALIKQADVVHARNLDIFLLAWLATLIASPPFFGKKKKMVYECLDVHETLTRQGLVSSLMRRVERRVLQRSALLIISSPGFLSQYFEPMQNYSGPHHWIENKLNFEDAVVARPAITSSNISEGEPIVIAWVGVIRCQETLALLKAVALAEPKRVIIRISGLVSYFLIEDFDEQIAGIPNIEFLGPYEWPQGLENAYEGAHFVWAQELSWSGHNSDWLIPCRVYEGSYFGAIPVAVAGTQTADYISSNGLGIVLPDASEHALTELVRNSSAVEIRNRKTELLSIPAAKFMYTAQDSEAISRAIQQA